MTEPPVGLDSMSEDQAPDDGLPPKKRRRLGLPRRERLFAVLPTMLTLGNACCGFAAITYAARIGWLEPETQTIESALLISAGCIYGAMIFDALDGRAARWANQTSEFGAQLDSLCDAISFGVAPAFLMRQFCQHSSFPLRILWMIGALYVVCAILRLARFNVETEEDDSHTGFSGLPSPAAAGVVASFPIAQYGLENLLIRPQGDITEVARTAATWMNAAVDNVLPIATFAVACLMVSRIPYSHVFNQLFSGRRNRWHLIQLLFAIPLVFVAHELAVPLIFCYFAFSAPVRVLWEKCFGARAIDLTGPLDKPQESTTS